MQETRPQGLIMLGAMLACTVYITGCAPGGWRFPKQAGQEKTGQCRTISDYALQSMLNNAYDRFALTVMSAADAIKRCSGSMKVRRRAVYWESRLIPAFADIINQSDPRVALTDMLAFTKNMERILSNGAGKDIFGKCQSHALEAAEKARSIAMDVAAAVLSPKELDELDREMESWAEQQTIPIQTGPDIIDRMCKLPEPGRNLPQSVASIVLVPFELIHGIDVATRAVTELSRTGDRLALMARQAPDAARWSAELWVYDVMADPQIHKAMQSFNQLAEDMSRLAKLAREISKQTQGTAPKILKDLQARIQDSTQLIAQTKTLLEQTDRILDKSEKTAISINTMLNKAETVYESMEQGNISMIKASTHWRRTISQAQDLSRSLDAANQGAIRAAREMAQAAERASALVSQVRQAVEPESLEGLYMIMDRAALLVALLIVVFFSCLCLYRMVMNKRRPGS